MSALIVELPDKLHEKAREVAAAKNLSMDALVAIALAAAGSSLYFAKFSRYSSSRRFNSAEDGGRATHSRKP